MRIRICEELRNDLPDFLRGRMSAEDRNRIEEHLATCASCREEAASLEKTFSHIAEAPSITPPETYWRNFLPRLHERITERQTRRRVTPNVGPVPWINRFLIPSAALVATVLILFQIRIVPVEESPSSELRQIVAQMNAEELQSATKIATQTLIPEPFSHQDVVFNSEEVARPIVDSLLALRSAELEKLAETNLLGLNEIGLESLTEDELKTVLARLEGTGVL